MLSKLLPNNGKGMLIIQRRLFLREVKMSWHSSNFPPKRSSVAIGSDLLQDGNDVIAECLELEGQGFESPFKQFFRSRMSLFQISIEKKIQHVCELKNKVICRMLLNLLSIFKRSHQQMNPLCHITRQGCFGPQTCTYTMYRHYGSATINNNTILILHL